MTVYKKSKGYDIKLKGLKKLSLTVASYDLLCLLCHEYGDVKRAYPHVNYDYVKFEKDTEEVAKYVTELFLSNKISWEQAENFPKILLAKLFAMSEILGRDLESDLKQAREAYEKHIKKD